MRKLNECKAEIFRRMDEGIGKRRERKKSFVKIASSVCFLALAVILGIGAWQNGLIDLRLSEADGSVEATTENNYVIFAPPTDETANHTTGEEQSVYLPETSCDPVNTDVGNLNETSVEDTEPPYDEPMKEINVVYNFSLGESAATDHRPAGYSFNIGPALALKMSITEDEDYKYTVIVTFPENTDPKQFVEDINAKVSTKSPIDFKDAMKVNFSGGFNLDRKLYFILTADQITALAENGAKCSYVGSGEGKYEDQNFDTPHGISTYCELHGDSYVFGDPIIYSPDISIVD